MNSLGVNLSHMRELDLVDLWALSAGSGSGIGQSDFELLRTGFEGQLADAEDVLATVIHATRGKTEKE
jgi:hypothetical protein